MALQVSSGWDAGQQEPAHITLAVLQSFDCVRLCEVFDREMRLERQQLCYIWLGLLRTPEVTEGGDQGPVARTELRISLYSAAPHKHCLFVIAFEKISERIRTFKPKIGI